MTTALMRPAAYLLAAAAFAGLLHATVLVAIACGSDPTLTPAEVYAQTLTMAGEFLTGGAR